MVRFLPYLFAQFRSGESAGRTLEFRLTERAAQGVRDALVLDYDLRLAAVDAFATNGIGNHSDLAFWDKSVVTRYSRTRRSRSALVTTETELSAMAAPAKIGESSRPKTGYSTPAAIGTPSAL